MIDLFLVRDERAVLSPAIVPPRPYNNERREYNAPTNADNFDPQRWPSIVGVVDANTRFKPTRILLFGDVNDPDSLWLMVEAEILDGKWKGMRINASSLEFVDETEYLENVSFKLKDVGEIKLKDLPTFSPDERFVRIAENNR